MGHGSRAGGQANGARAGRPTVRGQAGQRTTDNGPRAGGQANGARFANHGPRATVHAIRFSPHREGGRGHDSLNKTDRQNRTTWAKTDRQNRTTWAKTDRKKPAQWRASFRDICGPAIDGASP
jgi:hypothetical protein